MNDLGELEHWCPCTEPNCGGDRCGRCGACRSVEQVAVLLMLIRAYQSERENPAPDLALRASMWGSIVDIADGFLDDEAGE